MPATASELNNVYGVWGDASDNIYIADAFNNRVRKVSPSGIISTIAGNGSAGYSGDGGPATLAQLSWPINVATDRSGNVYILDYDNHRIREIKNGGESGSGIFTIAGNGTAAFSGDGGQATNAEIYHPQGLFIDASDNIYFGDEFNHRVRKITPSGIITTIAGNGTSGYTGDGIAATASGLNYPSGVAVDAAGNVYIADYQNNRIRKINTSGIISTVAGNGILGYSGDGGPATLAELRLPKELYLDAANNIYITDADNQRVRKINAVTGIITTIAGNGIMGYGGDGGLATLAEINEVQGIYINRFNDIFLGDVLNNRVRIIRHMPTTGNSVEPISDKVDIYPNPASSSLIIRSSGPAIENIAIYNLVGQNIFNSHYNTQQVCIDISGIPSGLYMIKINDTELRKIIKE